jgi:hypothetical protein
MQSEGIFKPLLIAFGVALLGYGLMFGCDRHLRTHKGAWELTFSMTAEGLPILTIDQPYHRIRKVSLVIEGEQYEGPTKRLSFDDPSVSIPFGEIVFLDTTYLPGSISLDLFGHLVDLMPHKITINLKGVPWKEGELIRLRPEEAASRLVPDLPATAITGE